MKFPEYVIDTVLGKNTLVYGYSRVYRKWKFTADNGHTMLVPCHGAEQGHKIANIIAGSLKRSGKVDGLARSNIYAVCE